MVAEREINQIQYMIYKGKAYCTTIDNIGTYVIASAKYFVNINEKIEHEHITPDHKQNPDDFVVWYPIGMAGAAGAAEAENRKTLAGVDSPWGVGKPSANLYVRCMY